MSLDDLAGIAADARLYLRPVGMVDSPQRFDGQSARLAGTMLWFGQVELTARAPSGQTVRALVPVAAWDAALAALPAALRDRASLLFGRLTAPRAALTLGERVLPLDQPQVMGILNMTPDSFSDGGKHLGDPGAAADAGFAMSAAGAAIIDIGGESTRPGAKPVWEGDEIARVQPLIERLARAGAPMSIDTRKAAVMEAALAAGAHMLNDVSALAYDDRSLDVAAACDAPVVLMHAAGQGDDMHGPASYDDVALDVFDWLEARVEQVAAAGVARERIWVDPGIGFGKSLTDNLLLTNNLAMLHGLGCPILFGASRKRMIGALSNEAAADQRLGGSIALAMKAVEQGAQIVRVHDVPETVQALRVWRGLRDAALMARV